MLALIEARYHESGLNTDIMAQEMAMSRTALFERVRMEFDTTPAALLLSARIAHATEMLKSGDRPVGEIAVLCGFSDAKYFSKVYKKQTGKSPSLLLHPPQSKVKVINGDENGDKVQGSGFRVQGFRVQGFTVKG